MVNFYNNCEIIKYGRPSFFCFGDSKPKKVLIRRYQKQLTDRSFLQVLLYAIFAHLADLR